MPRGDFDGEEVGRGEDLPMELQKPHPVHTRLAALRSRLKVVATQDVAHGQLIAVMSQIRECPLNPAIAPGRIVCGHLDHELLDLCSDTRSATQASLCAPVKLCGDEALIPSQEGVGGDEGRDLLETLATE